MGCWCDCLFGGCGGLAVWGLIVRFGMWFRLWGGLRWWFGFVFLCVEFVMFVFDCLL